MTMFSSAHTDCKKQLDGYWGVHSYTKLANCYGALAMAGVNPERGIVEDLLFSDPFDAEFFRAAMWFVLFQTLGKQPRTYERIQGLLRTYIQKANQATVSTLASA